MHVSQVHWAKRLVWSDCAEKEAPRLSNVRPTASAAETVASPRNPRLISRLADGWGVPEDSSKCNEVN